MRQNLKTKDDSTPLPALSTAVCPVCKQLKLLDGECQSAFCQEMRRASQGSGQSPRLRRLANWLRP